METHFFKLIPIRRTLLFLLTMVVLSLFACSKQETRKILSKSNSIPGTVSNVKVENLNGGARITYDLPKEIDLLYVTAEYEINPDLKRETKVSFYDNELYVDGFGDTDTHIVLLRTVNRAGKSSEPIEVPVNPLESPISLAFSTLGYEKDFGGITASYYNEVEANLVANVIMRDSLGQWQDIDKNYNALKNARFSVRGLEAVPSVFGIFLEDRWGNTSDTLIKELTPLFEEKADKGKFRPLELPGDVVNKWSTIRLWDDDIKLGGNNGFKSDNSGFPASFTINLGQQVQLSRFKLWQVHDGREYGASNIKTFQLWGSNNPDSDGGWENWTLLTEDEFIKPSGLPIGTLSDEDRESAEQGDEFILPLNSPSIRYVRFVILSTWVSPAGASTGEFWLLETTFWGDVSK